MATCFENLVKHFELVIRQLEHLKRQDSVPEEEEEKIWELLNKAGDLCMKMFQYTSITYFVSRVWSPIKWFSVLFACLHCAVSVGCRMYLILHVQPTAYNCWIPKNWIFVKVIRTQRKFAALSSPAGFKSIFAPRYGKFPWSGEAVKESWARYEWET